MSSRSADNCGRFSFIYSMIVHAALKYDARWLKCRHLLVGHTSPGMSCTNIAPTIVNDWWPNSVVAGASG